MIRRSPGNCADRCARRAAANSACSRASGLTSGRFAQSLEMYCLKRSDVGVVERLEVARGALAAALSEVLAIRLFSTHAGIRGQDRDDRPVVASGEILALDDPERHGVPVRGVHDVVDLRTEK